MTEKRLVKIGEAAALLGTTPGQLRKWEASGELLPARKTQGGTRYYDVAAILGATNEGAPTIGYARVSSHHQKPDLARQRALLEAYCAAKGWRYEIIEDLGSGMNYHKKGLHRVLDLILKRKMRRLVLLHKDRLLRFGAELIFSLCEIQGIEVVVVNQGQDASFEEDLAKDVLEIITVFSARLYGNRSHQNKQVLQRLQEAGDALAEQHGLFDERTDD
jgi:predicted site-specific integrase-resolvase